MTSTTQKGTLTVPLFLLARAGLRSPSDPACPTRAVSGRFIERRPRDIAGREETTGSSLRRTCCACLLTAVICVGATLVAMRALSLREPYGPSRRPASDWYASR